MFFIKVIFRSLRQNKKSCINTRLFIFCAPARTRTWNDGSEDRCDIHFTTSAYAF